MDLLYYSLLTCKRGRLCQQYINIAQLIRHSMVMRRSEKSKGIKETQWKFNTQNYKKLRIDLFILIACIIHY